MKHKNIIILFFSLMLVYVSFTDAAEGIKLSGRFITPDSIPLSNVSIRLSIANLEATSDSNGEFSFASNDIPTSLTGPNTRQSLLVFNGTVVKFSVPDQGALVVIELFDMLGKRHALLLGKELQAGNYSVNPFLMIRKTLTNGLYVLRVRIGTDVHSFKVPGVKHGFIRGNSFSNLASCIGLSKIQNNAIHDTLTAIKEGYRRQLLIINSYSGNIGTVVMYPVPEVVVSKNIGTAAVAIYPQSSQIDSGVLVLSGFTGTLKKTFENDSVIVPPMMVSCSSTLSDTSGFVVRIPVNCRLISNPNDLTVFAILQTDSLSVQHHGYLCGDTLTVHLPSIDSGMVIAAGYNPNMVSIDVDYDSLLHRTGLNKRSATTTTWPRYRWWCAFDQLDSYLRQYAADYRSISLASVTAHDINIFLIDRLIIPAIEISFTYDRMGFRAPEFDSIRNPPHSHIDGDYLLGSYQGYYYKFFLTSGSTAKANGEIFSFFKNEDIGIFISTYWLNRFDPAMELGSAKGIFSHELMHGIINGYDLDHLFISHLDETKNSYEASLIYHEAIATVCGHTLDYNLSGTNGIFVRPSPATLTLPSGKIVNNHEYLLDFPLLQDNHYKYNYHDFFAYYAKKYKSGKLDYLAVFLQTLSSNLSWTTPYGWTLEQYIQHNLKSTNTFFGDSLWYYYTDFICNRAYEHDKPGELRTGDPVADWKLNNSCFSTAVQPIPALSKVNDFIDVDLLSFQVKPLTIAATTAAADIPLSLMIVSNSVKFSKDSLEFILYPEGSDGTGSKEKVRFGSNGVFRWSLPGAQNDTMVIDLTNFRKEGVFYGTLLLVNCAFREVNDIKVQLITAPDFTISITPSATGVVPHAVGFKPQLVVNSSPVGIWEWDFGDGDSSRFMEPNHMYVSRGSYSISVKAGGPGGYRHYRFNNCITVDPYTIAATLNFRKSLECTGSACNQPINGVRSGITLDFGSQVSNVDGTFAFKLAGEENNCASGCTLFISKDMVTWEPLWLTRQGVSINSGITYEGNIYDENRQFRYIAAYAPLCGMEMLDFTIHQKPHACITCNAIAPVVGSTVILDATCSSPLNIENAALTSFRWDFGDGRLAIGQNVQHSYQWAGTFRVKLFIEDFQGGNDWSSTALIVTNH